MKPSLGWRFMQLSYSGAAYAITPGCTSRYIPPARAYMRTVTTFGGFGLAAQNCFSGFTPLTASVRQIDPKSPARWLDWRASPSTASPLAYEAKAKPKRPPRQPLAASVATTTVAGATTVAAAARASASTICVLLHGTSSEACVRRHRQRLQQRSRHQRRQTRSRRAVTQARVAARETPSSNWSTIAVRPQPSLRSRNE